MNTINSQNRHYFKLGMLFFLFGLIYYCIFREAYLLSLFSRQNFQWIEAFYTYTNLPIQISELNSLPSFIHVLAFSYSTLGLVQFCFRQQLLIPIIWCFINISFEFGQHFIKTTISSSELLNEYFITGVFDWLDILASLLACVFVIIHLTINNKLLSQRNCPSLNSLAIIKIPLYGMTLLGLVSIMGTSSGYPHYSEHEPIYLSYEELRESINTDNNVSLSDIGKIYLYQDFLFINSRNQGVFIYDNKDPKNPKFIAFINVPGNIDIAIKNTHLYVDSFIDLVVIDISDAKDIHEINRIKNVFPYNAYQTIPEGIYLNTVNREKGVVIGYKEKNNAE